MVRAAAIILLLGTAACSNDAQDSEYTLYRDSPFDTSMRVHWATFDAPESDAGYNMDNCQMAARLLNANFKALAAAAGKPPMPGVGFWCEKGPFLEKGAVPSYFEAAYPTDVYPLTP